MLGIYLSFVILFLTPNEQCQSIHERYLRNLAQLKHSISAQEKQKLYPILGTLSDLEQIYPHCFSTQKGLLLLSNRRDLQSRLDGSGVKVEKFFRPVKGKQQKDADKCFDSKNNPYFQDRCIRFFSSTRQKRKRGLQLLAVGYSFIGIVYLPLMIWSLSQLALFPRSLSIMGYGTIPIAGSFILALNGMSLGDYGMYVAGSMLLSIACVQVLGLALSIAGHVLFAQSNSILNRQKISQKKSFSMSLMPWISNDNIGVLAVGRF